MLFSFQILSFILATLLCFRHRRERSSFLHMTARRSFDPCAGRSCVWECAPARGGTIGNALRVALRINSGIRFFIRDSEKPAGFSESPFHGRGRRGKRQVHRRFLRKRGAAGKTLLGASGLNSLSQSLTALTAPSGREPLARPQALHFSRKLCRHAKGPIPEGAVERMRDWGSSARERLRGRNWRTRALCALAGNFAAMPKAPS